MCRHIGFELISYYTRNTPQVTSVFYRTAVPTDNVYVIKIIW